MKKQFKKIILIITLVFSLALLGGCEDFNSFFESSNGDKETVKLVNVTFDYNLEGYSPFKLQILKSERVYEPLTPLVEEFVFVGWHLNDELFDFDIKIETNITLVAKWVELPEQKEEEKEYEEVIVTVVASGDEYLIESFHIEKDSIFEFSYIPVRKGYTFIGWYEDLNNDTAFDLTNPITQNIVLIAKWDLLIYDITITFVYDLDNVIEVIYNNGSIIEEPEALTLEGKEFFAWVDTYNNNYTFTTREFADLTIYAIYNVSMKDHFNKISTEIIRANVQVVKTRYDRKMGGVMINKIVNTGSGVIFKQNNNDYYVLTNAHVVALDGSNYAEFEIVDYLEREHEAFIYLEFVDVDNDLAIMRFSTEETGLKCIKMSETQATYGELLTKIGQPKGQRNAISLGYLESVNPIYIGEVKTPFDALKLSVPGAAGSSGSMVINTNFELVGLIFAGGKDVAYEDAKYMYAIPLEAIEEFLVEFYKLFPKPVLQYYNNFILEINT